MKLLIYILISIFIIGCSSTNIDVKKSDLDWKYELDFYSDILDDILIEDSLLILKHYEYNYYIKKYIETIITIDKNSGNLIKYEKDIDTLFRKEIGVPENTYTKVNYSVRPILFEISPKYKIELTSDVSGQRHHRNRSYEFEITNGESKLTLNLDNLDISYINYYLSYSNELYIVLKPDSLKIGTIQNRIYKINIDNIIIDYKVKFD